ncbi:MAG: ERF family protein [Methanobrevibacter sp.]|nr:ERF family protein [Methanobrevibacter sp.]
MSIYDKIAEIQMELLDVEFEQKRGFHGEYMGLEVLTCKILPKCYEHGIFYYFTANETHLLLKIIDRETGEVLSPAPHVRLPELSKDMKVEGGNYTYMKRYLLMNTFMVIAESFDPDDTKDGLPPQKNNDASSAPKKNTKKESEPVRELNFQELVDKALEKLEKKGLSNEEITSFAVKKCIQNMVKPKLNKSEKKAMYAFVNEYFKGRDSQ